MLGTKDAGKDPEALAIDALGFIAGREELTNRFLDLTGLDMSQLRGEAAKPSFLVGVLDFLLGNEGDLIDFANANGIPPQHIGRARNQIAIKAGITPEDYPA